jgi:S-formylglutathione hydrolase
MRKKGCGLVLLATLATPLVAQEAALVEGTVESERVRELVGQPVVYYALLPPGYDAATEPLPLVLNLHGGGGSREVLARQQPLFVEMWRTREIHPMVIVTPSVKPRCFYMDSPDGSQRWETFLLGSFLDHLRSRFNVRKDRGGTMITGISMGGMGSLRIAFKYPDRFAAVAGMEPGIEPILAWSEMRPKHRFWRDDALMQAAYGNPIDAAHWAANNPATIVKRNAQQIRDSGLAIFLEAGDEDMFWLYEGTEFLHQVLWDERVRHDYRRYYGADHVGSSLGPRTREAYRFLSRTLDERAVDPAIEQARARIDPLKSQLSEADHYGLDGDLLRRTPNP